MNKAYQYEQAKREWVAKHPNATPEQYVKAMQAIARRLKF